MPISTKLLSQWARMLEAMPLVIAQQLAEVPAPAKDHVAEDEQAPPVADDLQRNMRFT
jgi:hypothetical protein